MRERVVSDQEGEHDLVVPQRGIWGTAGIGGWNIDKCAGTRVTASMSDVWGESGSHCQAVCSSARGARVLPDYMRCAVTKMAASELDACDAGA